MTITTDKLLTIKEAGEWASNYIGKNVTPSNIAYLIQYGRIKKIGENGSTQVSVTDLIDYYQSYNIARDAFEWGLGETNHIIYNTIFTEMIRK